MPPRSKALLVAGCVFIAWVGEFVHNLAELPQSTFFSPENSLVLLVGIVLFGVWYLSSTLRLSTILLLGWGLLHLIGGAILSVLPLPFWPYDPEQTLQHYLFHVIYGLAQLPLIILMIRELQLAPKDVKEESVIHDA